MSDLFTWSDIYSVDIPSIDAQHKKWFVLVNDLGAAMTNGVGKDAVDKVLAGVVDYTVTHFNFEEREMLRCNYVNYAQHKKIHDEFIARAKDMLSKSKADKSVASIELMLTLKDWLTNHILKQDKLYAPAMSQRKAA